MSSLSFAPYSDNNVSFENDSRWGGTVVSSRSNITSQSSFQTSRISQIFNFTNSPTSSTSSTSSNFIDLPSTGLSSENSTEYQQLINEYNKIKEDYDVHFKQPTLLVEENEEFAKIKECIISLKGKLNELKKNYEKSAQKFDDAIKEYKSKCPNFVSFKNETRNITEVTDKKIWFAKMFDKTSVLDIEKIKKEYQDAYTLYAGHLMKIKTLSGSVLPTTICQICFDNQVSFFIDPCGHTICTSCKENCEIRPKCHYCRAVRKEYKKIFI
jgi:hypothetical protein